tara:strand:+ start:65 stop:250 length:186 start_codon:yes stop_codon:yes gene_type:complete
MQRTSGFNHYPVVKRNVPMSGKHGAGKGDKYRQVDMKKYAENYEKIFGKKKKTKKKKESKK